MEERTGASLYKLSVPCRRWSLPHSNRTESRSREAARIVYLLWIPANTSWTEMLGISPAEAGERGSRTSEASTGPCSLPPVQHRDPSKGDRHISKPSHLLQTPLFSRRPPALYHPTKTKLIYGSKIPNWVHKDRTYSSGMWNWKVRSQRFEHHSLDSSEPISPLNSYHNQNSRNVNKQVFKLVTSTCA